MGIHGDSIDSSDLGVGARVSEETPDVSRLSQT